MCFEDVTHKVVVLKYTEVAKCKKACRETYSVIQQRKNEVSRNRFGARLRIERRDYITMIVVRKCHTRSRVLEVYKGRKASERKASDRLSVQKSKIDSGRGHGSNGGAVPREFMGILRMQHGQGCRY